MEMKLFISLKFRMWIWVRNPQSWLEATVDWTRTSALLLVWTTLIGPMLTFFFLLIWVQSRPLNSSLHAYSSIFQCRRITHATHRACQCKAVGLLFCGNGSLKGGCWIWVSLFTRKKYLKPPIFCGDLYHTKHGNMVWEGNESSVSAEAPLHKCALRLHLATESSRKRFMLSTKLWKTDVWQLEIVNPQGFGPFENPQSDLPQDVGNPQLDGAPRKSSNLWIQPA